MAIEEIAALLAGVVIFLMLLVISTWLYVAYRKLEEIEAHLREEDHAHGNRRAWSGGPVDRMIRLTYLGCAVAFPRFYCKQSDIDEKTIENLPRRLKLWIIIPDIFAATLLVMLTALWGFGKYKGWID
ncbi:hypothetical protein SAMN05661010_02205 [Modicisalibacter muralis]|uniref:Uncharacterized protein n=1 Tax=Modicisalibacter muralis TaxID=119000 RepID=A0A1G9LQQ2_9GAMM|nr:hypothetical protein [Halomonas muralis]SDL64071.1 hypothetical protein SAMN05661010_02205 [Halomonas muralis]